MADLHFWDELEPDDLPGDLREIAHALGMEEAKYFVQRWGGVQIYIPSPNTLVKQWRDEQILQEWDGRNEGLLAERYGVARRYVYDLIKQGRAEDQADLFDAED